MQRRYLPIIAGIAIALVSVAQAAEHRVTNADGLNAAIAAAAPGDEIIMRDGTWTDLDISFETDGTPDVPIMLRAETPGQVVITGTSAAAIRGDYLIMSGLVFRDGAPPFSREAGSLKRHRSILGIGGEHNRVTNCAFIDYNTGEEGRVYHWVAIGGRENRVDHCYFRGQTDVGNTVMVGVQAGSPTPMTVETCCRRDSPIHP